MASVLIAVMTMSCTTIERVTLPLQPIIINHYYVVPVPVEPEEDNCGEVPNCWYEPDGSLGEA